jgi:hypothetical protein
LKTKNLSETEVRLAGTLCRVLHSEQEKKDQTAVKKPAAATQNRKAKHLVAPSLHGLNNPWRQKPRRTNGLSRNRLNREQSSA